MTFPNTLSDWLALLEIRHTKNIDMGLLRVNEVKKKLGIFFQCPIITVAGTNGKGSTCSIIESILICAGYRVGLYIKPHFLCFNERARISGIPVHNKELISAFKAVEICRGNIPLSYFEFTTLAIMKLMFDMKLDIVIFEVGLGGRLDAVNIVDADVSIVTNIDIDHIEYLGNSREEIGFEKAGIYRTNKTAICSDPIPPTSLIQYAESINADLWLIERDFNFIINKDKKQWIYNGRNQYFNFLVYPHLKYLHQLFNTTAALAGLEALQKYLPISESAIHAGLTTIKLPGRFQVLSGQPIIVLDVAHNSQAVAILAQNLNNMGFYSHTYAVFGAMLDKDIVGMINHLKEKIDYWCVTDLLGGRGASAQQLKNKLLKISIHSKSKLNSTLHTINIFNAPDVAFKYALRNAKKNDRIVVFGSFLVVAAAMKVLKLVLN